jgi:Arc/MetJ-type ribon-helix-helix transcriptional regulator
MPKKVQDTKLQQINYRVPHTIANDIDMWVELGYFKDRSDFSYQAAISFLEVTKARHDDRLVSLESLPFRKKDTH